MLTIEKNKNADEIFIHATPEDLRGFAKKLWQLSNEAEDKGMHKEQFNTSLESDIELSNGPCLNAKQNSIIKKITISSKPGA